MGVGSRSQARRRADRREITLQVLRDAFLLGGDAFFLCGHAFLLGRDAFLVLLSFLALERLSLFRCLR